MPPRSHTATEARLRRIFEYNDRLREQLDLPRISVSEAGSSLIQYCTQTQDKLIPSVWGNSSANHDPYSEGSDGYCFCSIM